MNRALRFVVLFCFVFAKVEYSTAETIYEEIWINNGISHIVDDPELPYTAYNSSDIFQVQNKIFSLIIGDSLVLTIHNNDTLIHGFSINTADFDVPLVLNPGETGLSSFAIETSGAFIYFDQVNFPHYKSLGAAGVFHVKSAAYSTFYWNIKEHDKNWNTEVVNGTFPALTDYDPLYFTLNGVSNPDTHDDPISKITGFVNDTLLICIANTGQMAHSLHFHGYHLTITYSSTSTAEINREKDTYAIRPMETVILRLIPDKPGIYPVHDHNLVATSGNGIYANGLFQLIEISE